MFGGMDFMIITGRIPSGWIIDIWDCHGVLKPEEYAGYGNKSDEILEELGDFVWFECGRYTVPLHDKIVEDVRKAGLEEELSRKLERVLDWIVYHCNGGAINFSGFYMVSVDELRAIDKSVARVLNKIWNKERLDLLQYLF